MSAALAVMPQKLDSWLDRIVALLGVALVLATGAVLLADDGASGGAQAQQASAAAKAVDKVQIEDFLYEPAAITVAVGTEVTFTNEDAAPHTATSGELPKPDGVFDTGILEKGESRSVKLDKAGTFAYYCELHPFMKGTVIVE